MTQRKPLSFLSFLAEQKRKNQLNRPEHVNITTNYFFEWLYKHRKYVVVYQKAEYRIVAEDEGLGIYFSVYKNQCLIASCFESQKAAYDYIQTHARGEK